jgi:hypothetical protein
MPDSKQNANERVDDQPQLVPPAETAQGAVPPEKSESRPASRLRLLSLVTSVLMVFVATAWVRPAYRFPISVAVGTFFGLLTLWLGPKWQVAHLRSLAPADLFEQENEARKTLAQIIGGVLVLAGLYYTNENIEIARNAADQTHKAATESSELMRQGQLTDRFSKAVEQLGKEDSAGKNSYLPTRLGGIYALERIAKESKEDHWPIVELLIQYLYAHDSIQQNRVAHDARKEIQDLSPEGQAILTALGRRKVEYETSGQKLFLMSLNLEGAQLTGNFSNAAFDGSNLQSARLFDVNLQGSSFTMTDLTVTRFKNADLKRAVFNSVKFVGTPSIHRSTLTFTDFIDADMTDVVGLTCKDVESAHVSNKTILPSSLGTCNIVRTPFVDYYSGK